MPDGGARFDDLVADRSWAFDAPERVLRARSADEVPALLAEVDRATRAGRWAWGYLGYEAAPAFDAALATHPPADHGPPLAWFGIGAAPIEGPALPAPVDPPDGLGPVRLAWSADEHRQRVGRVRAEIAAGTAYQVNLTTTLRRDFTGEPRDLYASMAHGQRGRFNALLDLGEHVVVSAAPELFVEWTDDALTVRPMKGTARRGAGTRADERARAELVASSKQQAENLMIVDLLRNDLARIARTGSVRVGSLFDAERYETVWQLTSTVCAAARPGTGLAEIFGALFPCGSVTGAPKAAAMQLIAELEDAPRGVYCGALGMIAPPGSPFRARLSVGIRTAVLDRPAGTLGYGVGSGITWSSVPEEEWDELLAKAAVLDEPGTGFHLLETLALLPRIGPRNLERHLGRLAGSARYFGFRTDLGSLRNAVAAAIDPATVTSPQRVRLLLHRDGTLDVRTAPLRSDPGPVTLAIDSRPTVPSRWTCHKTTRRAHYEQAAARHPSAGDVVLVDASGAVLETTRASIACRLGSTWYTPPLEVGCLPGVERGRLVEAGELRERRLTVDDVYRAKELAVISSLRGRRPARLLADLVPQPFWFGG